MAIENTYLSRADFFLRHYELEGTPPEVRSFLLAAAVHAADSAREELVRLSEQPLFPEALSQRIRSIKRGNLIERVRNMDVHGNPLPVSFPGTRVRCMITGSVRPLVMSSEDGTEVSVSLPGASPRIHRTPNNPRNSRVKFGDSVTFDLVDGRHFTCDFANGSEEVDLALATREFVVEARAIFEELG